MIEERIKKLKTARVFIKITSVLRMFTLLLTIAFLVIVFTTGLSDIIINQKEIPANLKNYHKALIIISSVLGVIVIVETGFRIIDIIWGFRLGKVISAVFLITGFFIPIFTFVGLFILKRVVDGELTKLDPNWREKK